MDLQVFADVLEREIRRQSEQITAIERKTIRKNNDVNMEAFILYGKDSMIAPTVYLQSFYELYREGVSIKELGAMAVRSFSGAIEKGVEGIGTFFDYDKVKDRIYCRLVSRSRNREGIRDLCHEEWADLAVTYYHLTSFDSGERAIVQIRNMFPEKWEISGEQLREDAWRNTLRDCPAVMKPMDKVLAELQGQAEVQTGGHPLYVLTNSEKVLGAVAIAYPGETERIAEKLGSGYYVIPSSVHECLILPEGGCFDPEDLNGMVREINRTQVSPQEVLSDHVYYYSREQGRILYAEQQA